MSPQCLSETFCTFFFFQQKGMRITLWVYLSVAPAIRKEVRHLIREEAERVKKVKSSSGSSRKMRPALTPEARENQMIALAVDLAEKQLMDGTASSQVMTHYLKLGSTKERIEKEILEKQKELIDAKTENLKSNTRMEELYEKAISAMRTYSGQGDSDEY